MRVRETNEQQQKKKKKVHNASVCRIDVEKERKNGREKTQRKIVNINYTIFILYIFSSQLSPTNKLIMY